MPCTIRAVRQSLLHFILLLGSIGSQVYGDPRSHPLQDKFSLLIEKAIKSEQDTTVAIAHYKMALQIADSIASPEKKAYTLNQLGKLYYNRGLFRQAYQYFSRGYRLADSSNLQKEKAMSLKGIAHIEWRMGENVQSITKILESIALFKTHKDTTEIINASNILGGIYVSMGNLKAAASIYNEMLNLAIASGDSVSMAQVKDHLGVVAFFKKNYEEAIRYYEQSLAINRALNRDVQVGINYANIGETFDYQGNHQKATGYFHKAVSLLEKNQFNSALIFAYYGLGRSYTNMGMLTKGIENYKKSLEYIALTGENREKTQVYGLLAENYALQGKYQLAYAYYGKKSSAKDSIDNMEKNRQIETIRAKYEIKEQEHENARLIKENERKKKDLEGKQQTIIFQSVLVGLLFLLILLFVFLYLKIKSQQAQLQEANKTKDQLLSIISHDLRGPIGNLRAITELIVQNQAWGGNPELKAVFSGVKNDINKVFYLLHDLLDWANIQREGMKPHPENLNLKAQVDKTAFLLQPNAARKEITVNVNVGEEYQAKADEAALQTILRNLLTNAIKFSNRGGNINILARPTSNGKYFLVSFEDQGVGISAEKVKQLLSKKIYSTPGTEQEKGMGIGLSICKQFIEQSGGELTIDSHVGHGSVFSFTIPAFF